MSREKQDIAGIDKQGIQDAFKVPENYFEELPAAIQQKIKQTPIKRRLITNPYFQAAASIAAAVVISILIMQSLNTKKTTPIQTALNKEDVYEVLTHDADNFDLSDDILLEEAIEPQNLTAPELNDTIVLEVNKSATEQPKKVEVSREDIIEYLSEYENENEQ